jgi:hypothetical protein
MREFPGGAGQIFRVGYAAVDTVSVRQGAVVSAAAKNPE